MRTSQIKVGRNDACPCDSGKKYKKCCLSLEEISLHEPTPVNIIARQKSEERLRQRIHNHMGGKFTMLSGELEVKMSEVILHLAEDLLSRAKTKSQHQKAIAITCMAWNLGVMFEPEQQKDELEEFLNNFDDALTKQDIRDIVMSIIEKKNHYYPNINRTIIDHELIGNKNDFHLNVVSTVPEEALTG